MSGKSPNQWFQRTTCVPRSARRYRTGTLNVRVPCNTKVGLRHCALGDDWLLPRLGISLIAFLR